MGHVRDHVVQAGVLVGQQLSRPRSARHGLALRGCLTLCRLTRPATAADEDGVHAAAASGAAGVTAAAAAAGEGDVRGAAAPCEDGVAGGAAAAREVGVTGAASASAACKDGVAGAVLDGCRRRRAGG